MTWKTFIEYYYEQKIYSDQDVARFVKKGQITASDYKEITGKEYEPKDTTK